MLIARIEGANRVCGKSQGFLGLPVRDEKVTLPDGTEANVMHMAFELTPGEFTAMMAGGKIIVSVIGDNPQPIMLGVGK